MTHPLISEAGKKAAIAWVSVGKGPAYAAWCLPVEGVLAVVLGPGEQSVPGLADAEEAFITLRGDHGGGIVTYPALVQPVPRNSELWETVTTQLASKRLNAPGPAGELIARWEKECTILTLTASGDPLPPDDSSGAQEVRPTTAAPVTRKPFKLHRVRRNRA